MKHIVRFSLGGVVIPEGTNVQTRASIYDYRVGYVYSLVTRPTFRFLVGGSLAYMETRVGFSDGGDYEVSAAHSEVRPLLRVSGDLAPAPRWLLHAGLDWWSDSEVKVVDGTVQVGYRVHPNWLLTLGLRRVERRIDAEELFSDTDRNQVALGIVYGW